MTAAPLGPVVVAGGRGDVGTMLAAALRRDGNRVHILDPTCADDAAPQEGSSDMAIRADIMAPTPAAESVLRAAATVVLAVPEPVALAALPPLAALLPPDALLVDTLSVKTAMADAVHSGLPDRAALGINPMFAPSLGMAGRPVTAVVYRDGPPVDRFVAALRRWDARVVPVGADEHDRVTATTQALTHATVLAFGLALDTLDPPAAADTTAPPPHMLLRALLARVASGVPEVYHDIQAANPYAAQARRALRSALDELDAAADDNRIDAFDTVMTRASTALEPGLDRYRAICGQLLTMLPSAPPGPDLENGGPR
ncbi:prephenate dehydrogenase [Rhodococcus sp. SMB37]|uniref:prephenate dehydrogenase/arogenate dehydrogenase family protein n=1 Tax=Rhodococcus sp. SMB37 TaxID=2512213 RepID=UPI0010ECBD0A|nr:prephenate dehydrogenase/arogenate dehydrogenase family protein [Rhodococcus sp. SMB37]TCN50451.1 prephenate dehydrogenase [Rhodococcus sp. SMB37]